MLVVRPVLLMLATPVPDELQVAEFVRFWVLPSEYVPVAVNCSVVPKAIDGLAGVTAIEVKIAATPLPLSETVCGVLPALSLKLSVPVLVPTAVGENVTDAVQLLPAPSVFGLSGQLDVTPKTVVPLVMLVIFRAAVWLFVNVTVCDGLVVPTAWSANVRLLRFKLTG
jgi:hypothetical protein